MTPLPYSTDDLASIHDIPIGIFLQLSFAIYNIGRLCIHSCLHDKFVFYEPGGWHTSVVRNG